MGAVICPHRNFIFLIAGALGLLPFIVSLLLFVAAAKLVLGDGVQRSGCAGLRGRWMQCRGWWDKAAARWPRYRIGY